MWLNNFLYCYGIILKKLECFMEWYFILIIIVFALTAVASFGVLIKKDWELRKRVSEMVQNQVTKNGNDFLNDYKLLAQKKEWIY